MPKNIRRTGLIVILLAGTAAGVGLGWKLGLFASSPIVDQDQGTQTQTAAQKSDVKETPVIATPTGFTEPEILAHLHKLTPAERMTWMAKVLNKDRDFKPVGRDSLKLTVAGQGAMVTDSTADVTCLISGKIRGIVADGAMVKAGDKLLEIDDKARKELLQKHNLQIAEHAEALRQATTALGNVQKDAQSIINEAKTEWKLAELDLKRYKGQDAQEKKRLQLRLELTAQALERAKSGPASAEARANADVQAKKAHLDQVLAEQLVLEGEIGRCVVLAPRQGMVIYHLAPQEKAGETTIPTLRPGETVSQGQIVMRVCDDLDHLYLAVNIDASHASQIRPGQLAYVRVVELPNRVFAAKVKSVGTPVKGPDGKGLVLPTKIEIKRDLQDLHPLWSGSAQIIVDERANCLRLPLPSMVDDGKEKTCFVLTGDELHERKLTTGLATHQFVEILTGLESGDQVLGLQGVIRRQAEYLKYK